MLSNEQLELAAEALLAEVPDWIWNGEELPVPVQAIADDHAGLLVRDVADLSQAPGAPELGPDQSLSGLLLASRGEIWINASEGRQWPQRRRFTICHELGHWRLHREPGQQTLFCRKSAVDEEESNPKGFPPMEDEANRFAAALLMPRHLMREHYERLRRHDDCFERMYKLFGASQVAMGKRLHTAID